MRSQPRLPRLAALAVLATAATLAGAGRAEAQWGYGYGGYGGYGGWGWGGGGMFGNMGMSLYDQSMVKEQYYMLNASRFNLQNAAAEQSYQSANLMQQQAINTALENQRLGYQLAKETYDVETKAASLAQAARDAAPKVPIENLVNASGQVLWPDYAPSGGVQGERRDKADVAIRNVYESARTNGQAPVNQVVEANRRLHEYGEPALNLLNTRGDKRARAGMVDFLNALESAVQGMGGR
jgi:hypothetical protein